MRQHGRHRELAGWSRIAMALAFGWSTSVYPALAQTPPPPDTTQTPPPPAVAPVAPPPVAPIPVAPPPAAVVPPASAMPSAADANAAVPPEAYQQQGYQQQAGQTFTLEELETLLAPYALYPDTLLAQMLPPTAYPLELVQAQRWIERNRTAVKNGNFSGVDGQKWDPAVKAMVRFPTVVAKLNEDLDATSNIGAAFISQPEDVSAAIQALRLKAEQVGSLKSNDRQVVTTRSEGGRNVVYITPADPDVV